jgi:hypothetical protein
MRRRIPSARNLDPEWSRRIARSALRSYHSCVRPIRGSQHRGFVFYLVLTSLAVLLILGTSLYFSYGHQVTWISRHANRSQAHYLALAALERATNQFSRCLNGPLVTPAPAGGEPSINEATLELLDFERAKIWARSYTYAEGELLEEGHAQVVAQLLDVSRNAFGTYVDFVDRVPPGLEPYREGRDKDNNPTPGAQILGGWSGRLKLTATAIHRDLRTVVECVKDVKVVDISPPAPNYTLFIHSNRRETLKEGTFILSNLTLPRVVLDLIHSLTVKLNEVLRIDEFSANPIDALRNVEAITRRLMQTDGAANPTDPLKLLLEMVQQAGAAEGQEAISSKVDDIILSLSPRDWGRVRTNGALQVYLPFFAPDDIIAYTPGQNVFGKETLEFGYSGSFNRLHDPYLSTYTFYEGNFSKSFRSLGNRTAPADAPRELHDVRYTLNTLRSFVESHPDRREVPNLERLEKQARQYAGAVYRGPVVFQGTKQNPIQLDGIWYCSGSVTIRGEFRGRGLIVAEDGITIADHVRHTSPLPDQDMLGLVALHGPITLGHTEGTTVVDAALYTRDGVKGTQRNGLKLFGNLACGTLGREEMPRAFECRFNPRIKNHMVDNLLGSVSRRLLSFRVLGDRPPARSGPRDDARAD